MKESNEVYDLFIVGGGINGAGIARDAAGRGYSVVLCEKDDLAQGTSSRSGKLIHGGLRYLEYFEFRLVREALIEREILLKAAPHLVWPLRFVLPHGKNQRPAWYLRLGLFIYDHLGGRKILPKSHGLNLKKSPKGNALKDSYVKGFEFSDCWVNDSRLVVLNALDAKERGALILPRTKFISAKRVGSLWEIIVRKRNGKNETFKAKSLVNAAGPWVEKIIEGITQVQSKYKIKLVKGSHLVLPKFWKGDHCFLFQNNDKRVIFVNPYLENFCLIGTTDLPFTGNPEDVAVDEAEKEYLIDAINQYLKKPLSKKDIIHSFSGVRPLFNTGKSNLSAETRDYVFEISDSKGRAPLLNVFGGKITTFRELSERAMDKLESFFNKTPKRWTADRPLPGGKFPKANFDEWFSKQKKKYSQIPPDLLLNYAGNYGTRIEKLLQNIRSIKDLGLSFGGGLYESEVRFLVENEWACFPEDILERRTKKHLLMSEKEIKTFSNWFVENYPKIKS